MTYPILPEGRKGVRKQTAGAKGKIPPLVPESVWWPLRHPPPAPLRRPRHPPSTLSASSRRDERKRAEEALAQAVSEHEAREKRLLREGEQEKEAMRRTYDKQVGGWLDRVSLLCPEPSFERQCQSRHGPRHLPPLHSYNVNKHYSHSSPPYLPSRRWRPSESSTRRVRRGGGRRSQSVPDGSCRSARRPCGTSWPGRGTRRSR